MKPDLVAAITAFNKASQPAVALLVTRDGRTEATLPRLGVQITVADATMDPSVKVTAKDIALLCEEARLAAAPVLTLLDAGLAALRVQTSHANA